VSKASQWGGKHRQMRAKNGAVVIAAALLLLACGGNSNSPATTTNSGNPFRILMIVNLTGVSSYYGQSSVQAFRAAAKVLNSSGGMLNRPIKIDYVDSQGDPTKSVSLLTERLNSGTKYDLCECGTFSAETLALLPPATKVKLLSTESGSPAAGDDPATYPYNFGPQPSLKYQVQPIVSYVQKSGYKKVGVLASTDLAGQTQMSLYQQQFAAIGIEMIPQQYNSTHLDFTAELQTLQAKNPDVVILFSFGAATGIILKNRAKLGWTTPLIADRTSVGQDLTTLLSKDQLTNVSEQHVAVDVPTDALRKNPRWQTMYAAVQAEGPLVQPLSGYSAMYDALLYFATAVQQAGSTDPDKVRQALENMKTPNPVPWVTWPHAIGYSSKEHFVVTANEDFAITALTHLVNGLDVPA